MRIALFVTGLPMVFAFAGLFAWPDRLTAAEQEAAEQDTAAIAEANSRLAFELYDQVGGDAAENVFFSPYSIYAALAMTLEGARGETADQMRDVLHVPSQHGELWPNERFHEVMGTLVAHFNDDDRPYALHVANALWGEQSMSFREEVLAVLQQHYQADLHAVDFQQAPEPSREQINEWVAQQTEGRIEDLLPPNTIDPDTRLVLTNAIYFKAAWATPFQEQQTQDRPFHLADGSEIEVPTMRERQLRVRRHVADDFQAIELPYEDDVLTMLILLPNDPDGLPGLVEQMDAEQLAEVVASLESVQAQVDLPKFSFESEFSLNDALESLGMPLAFSRDADFTGLSGDAEAEQLHISDAVHKAFIDVHEQGTEAAAATGIVAGITSMPTNVPEVKVDRPFLFLIRDTETEAVLFFGSVNDPR